MSSRKSALEERVDRVRQTLNKQLLDTQGPGLSPLMSDESVAVIVAAEARRSREMAMRLGPRAYLLQHDASNGSGGGNRRVSETNKTFLQNTIRSVETHNRREQIDSAWRQHGLLKKLDRGELLPNNGTDHNKGDGHRDGGRDRSDRHHRPRSRSPSSASATGRRPRFGSRRSRSRSRSGDQDGDDGGGSQGRGRSRSRSPRSDRSSTRPNGYGRSNGHGAASPCGQGQSRGNGLEIEALHPARDAEDGGSGGRHRGLSAEVAQAVAAVTDQRDIWAARKARAFDPSQGAYRTGLERYESSSTEAGEIKEHKLPVHLQTTAPGSDSDSSSSSSEGSAERRRRKKAKEHKKRHKRDKDKKSRHHKHERKHKQHKRERSPATGGGDGNSNNGGDSERLDRLHKRAKG